MRATFRKYLFLNIFFVFLLTFFLAFRYHTRQANQNAREMIDQKIRDTIDNINVFEQTCRDITEIVESDWKTTLNAFAELIQYDPAILTNQERIDEVANLLDVDALSISDENGILTAASPVDQVGYDMKSNEQSRAFMPAITDPDFFLFQHPQPRGSDGRFFQYTGCARKDQPGIIQYGDKPDWYEKIQNTCSIENLASGFRIGMFGQIFILRGEKLVSIDNQAWFGKEIGEFGIPAEYFQGNSGEFECTVKRDRLTGSEPSAEEEVGNSETLKLHCVYQKTGDYIVAGVLPNGEMYILRNQMMRDIIFIYGILFVFLFFLVSGLVDKIVIRGITQVNRSLSKITNGDLNEQVNVRHNKEFVSLSDGINSTVDALKKAIAETAARIDKEIEFARAIQSAALPVLDPYPFETREDFALYASMETAKGVGGDLYDFLMIDDDHLAVVIADVSGKGIPASLFMMKAKAVLRGEISTNAPADTIMTRANDLLSDNNTSAMFVTTFLGILELSTGKFTAVSAGHNPPVLIHPNQKPEYLDIAGGVILGAMEGMEYEKSELALQPGDRIYLYTDGVTEAMNPQRELFGEDRLLELLGSEEAASLQPQSFLRFVREKLHIFVDGAPQSDDITMMVIEYRGK